jgi:hypothetical protein
MTNKITINNPESLFDFLVEQCEKLDSKKITVDTAKAQAALAKQMNNIMFYRLDKVKFETFTKIKLAEIEGEKQIANGGN